MKPRLKWIPASTPPECIVVADVIMQGGDYAIGQGLYWKNGADTGFYVQAGKSLFPCPWVEWWIPMPSFPNKQIT